MSRTARHQSGPGALCPGTLYHITTRGVDCADIFHSSLDRLVFLANLADACLEFGLIVHAFCLMSNHLHLLIEDSRGVVSQAMHRALSIYAQYFNLTRPIRRSGHLFADRFYSKIIDSAKYYDAVGAYILCNPMKAATPMAASVEAYPWSSARLTLGESPDRVWREWLDEFGGVDSMLAALPRTRSKKTRRNRTRRFERLATSDWFKADAIRCGRSVSEYAEFLTSHINQPQPMVGAAEEKMVSNPVKPRVEKIPRVGAGWQGVALADRFGTIVEACGRFFAGDVAGDRRQTFGDLLCYALHRFCSSPVSRIAHATKRMSEGVHEAIRRVRALRIADRAWASLLWSIEWHLRWELSSGPWRE